MFHHTLEIFYVSMNEQKHKKNSEPLLAITIGQITLLYHHLLYHLRRLYLYYDYKNAYRIILLDFLKQQPNIIAFMLRLNEFSKIYKIAELCVLLDKPVVIDSKFPDCPIITHSCIMINNVRHFPSKSVKPTNGLQTCSFLFNQTNFKGFFLSVLCVLGLAT